jgi:Cd2+/Zn2+-exporting ATPase
LARAVVAAADARGLRDADVTEFESVAGFGLFGRIDGDWIGVGRPELFERTGHALPPEVDDALQQQRGATPVVVWTSRGRGGVLGLRDEIRPEARDALSLLHAIGVRRVVMLTGDHHDAAEFVASRLEIDEFHAGLKPEDKLEEIRRLASQGRGVAMVGDGVNDAPALAAATVGVAMGGGGSDVALETADVVLMRDDLRSLAEAVNLSQRTTHIIRQSLGIAMGMIVVLMASTLLNVLSLPLAVLGHEGSTVVVILNGLRLMRVPRVALPPSRGDSVENPQHSSRP